MTSSTGEDWSRADHAGAREATIVDEVAQDQTQITPVAAIAHCCQTALERQLGVPRPHQQYLMVRHGARFLAAEGAPGREDVHMRINQTRHERAVADVDDRTTWRQLHLGNRSDSD